MPQLGRTAALLARLMQTDGSSCSSSSGGIRSSRGSNSPAAEVEVVLLDHMANGVLGLWEAIVTSENREEGVSISQPQCLKALEPICALTRAVLRKLPYPPQSVRGGLVSDEETFDYCMHVANYVCGHLHMQVICFWSLLLLEEELLLLLLYAAVWAATVAKSFAACRWAS